jgi:hypothetical protein
VQGVPDFRDDEELLAALKESLGAGRPGPSELAEIGKNAYAWHDIDAELARLTYDSTRELHGAASTRSENATIRALTFTSAHLTIELEVNEDSMLGQVIPVQEGTVRCRSRSGVTGTVGVDAVGCFTIRPVPDKPFRLHCRTADGSDVLTSWITL